MTIGQIGEGKAMELLNDGNILFSDVRNNKEYQKKDIDFLLHLENGIDVFLEVKTDDIMAVSGNLFIEYFTNTKTKNQGWGFYCQCDILWFYDRKNEVIHSVEWEKLKEYIINNKNDNKSGIKFKEWIRIENKYSSAFLVSINKIKNCEWYKKMKINEWVLFDDIYSIYHQKRD